MISFTFITALYFSEEETYVTPRTVTAASSYKLDFRQKMCLLVSALRQPLYEKLVIMVANPKIWKMGIG